jgi:hypothetical protein
VVKETADWMVEFAWLNETQVSPSNSMFGNTKVLGGREDTHTELSGYKYDLGPPMYVVSEDTSPNATVNPSFELAYWRLGLSIAIDWMQRLEDTSSPSNLSKSLANTTRWKEVLDHLSPLPTAPSPSSSNTSSSGTPKDGSGELYSVYEGVPSDFWTDPAFTSDHPALVGLHGWLPPINGVNLDIAQRTAEVVKSYWNESEFWGPVLSITLSPFKLTL